MYYTSLTNHFKQYYINLISLSIL